MNRMACIAEIVKIVFFKKTYISLAYIFGRDFEGYAYRALCFTALNDFDFRSFRFGRGIATHVNDISLGVETADVENIFSGTIYRPCGGFDVFVNFAPSL